MADETSKGSVNWTPVAIIGGLAALLWVVTNGEGGELGQTFQPRYDRAVSVAGKYCPPVARHSSRTSHVTLARKSGPECKPGDWFANNGRCAEKCREGFVPNPGTGKCDPVKDAAHARCPDGGRLGFSPEGALRCEAATCPEGYSLQQVDGTLTCKLTSCDAGEVCCGTGFEQNPNADGDTTKACRRNSLHAVFQSQTETEGVWQKKALVAYKTRNLPDCAPALKPGDRKSVV